MMKLNDIDIFNNEVKPFFILPCMYELISKSKKILRWDELA